MSHVTTGEFSRFDPRVRRERSWAHAANSREAKSGGPTCGAEDEETVSGYLPELWEPPRAILQDACRAIWAFVLVGNGNVRRLHRLQGGAKMLDSTAGTGVTLEHVLLPMRPSALGSQTLNVCRESKHRGRSRCRSFPSDAGRDPRRPAGAEGIYGRLAHGYFTEAGTPRTSCESRRAIEKVSTACAQGRCACIGTGAICLLHLGALRFEPSLQRGMRGCPAVDGGTVHRVPGRLRVRQPPAAGDVRTTLSTKARRRASIVELLVDAPFGEARRCPAMREDVVRP